MTFKTKKNWVDKRIDAINKITKKRGWKSNDENPFFDEYINLLGTEAKTKREYKEERRKNAIVDRFESVIRKCL